MAGISRYHYVVSAPGGPFAFVPHPVARGLWVRTHPCVLVVDCEHCKAKVGELCLGSTGNISHGFTHWKRRRDARGKIARLQFSALLTVYSKRV